MQFDSEIGVTPLTWTGSVQDGHVTMIDQRALPTREIDYEYTGHAEIAASIRDMVIRGAPAIGIAAAFGVFLGARESIAAGRADLPAGKVVQPRKLARRLPAGKTHGFAGTVHGAPHRPSGQQGLSGEIFR